MEEQFPHPQETKKCSRKWDFSEVYKMTNVAENGIEINNNSFFHSQHFGNKFQSPLDFNRNSQRFAARNLNFLFDLLEIFIKQTGFHYIFIIIALKLLNLSELRKFFKSLQVFYWIFEYYFKITFSNILTIVHQMHMALYS